MKSAFPSWPVLLIALALAFIVAASPLVDWVQFALGQPAPLAKLWLFALVMFGGLVAAHSLDLWRELPRQRQQTEALWFGASQLLRALIYVATLVAGIALFRRADAHIFAGAIAANDNPWWQTVFDMTLIGVLCWLATQGADWMGERIWQQNRVRQLRAPDAARLGALAAPLVLRSQSRDVRYAALICAALSAMCWLVYGYVTIAARTKGAANLPAPTVAFAGLFWIALAFHLWRHSLNRGEISASIIRPRWGDAFQWWDVARVEETRHSKFMAQEEQHLVFRDAGGQLLWQLTLDEIDAQDRRNLLALFPPRD